MSTNIKAKYSISYNTLAIGIHKFEYQLDGEFFNQFEKSLVQDADLKVKLEFNKESERLFELSFIISGTVMLQCDRCLDNFSKKIEVSEFLIVKLGKDYLEEAENSIVWPERKANFDIAPHIFDYVEINIPAHNEHPLDKSGKSTCNIQMLEKLDEYLIENKEKSEEIDPRWDKLKGLLH